MNKSTLAYKRGIDDFKKGVTKNPYNYYSNKYQALAGWWEKGWNEAKDTSEKYEKKVRC